MGGSDIATHEGLGFGPSRTLLGESKSGHWTSAALTCHMGTCD